MTDIAFLYRIFDTRQSDRAIGIQLCTATIGFAYPTCFKPSAIPEAEPVNQNGMLDIIHQMFFSRY